MPLSPPNAETAIAAMAKKATPLPHGFAIASANGDADAVISCSPSISIAQVLEARYSRTTNDVPPSSASGMVRAGSRILLTGVVAFSNPVKANKVSATALPRPASPSGIPDMWPGVAPAARLSAAARTTASNGRILIRTVITESPPAVLAPRALTSARMTTLAMAAATMNPVVCNAGLSQAIADAVAMASAALAAQLLHQN